MRGRRGVLRAFDPTKLSSESLWESGESFIKVAGEERQRRIFYNAFGYFITAADTLTKELTFLCWNLCEKLV